MSLDLFIINNIDKFLQFTPINFSPKVYLELSIL